jgi:hypothetical protein
MTSQLIVVARGKTRRWQRQANAGGLSGRREYEGLQRVLDFKTFAAVVEG